MARSIDPRRETLRGTQWQNDTAALFGTRVAEPILVSGQRDRTQNRPDIWSQAIRAINRSSFLQVGGRPHMGSRLRGNDERGLYETEAGGRYGKAARDPMAVSPAVPVRPAGHTPTCRRAGPGLRSAGDRP